MGYEVDFLPVGEGERSGDAIALRFGDLISRDPSKQRVVVIDGGFQTSGEALVDHIKKYYGTSHVDLVVSTHPDEDHVSGLAVVLEKLDVECLWMHQPWNHAGEVAKAFSAGRTSSEGIRKDLRKSLETARDLENLAKRIGVPIVEPFAGLKDDSGQVIVLGPTQKYYESLLPEFLEKGQETAATNAFLKAIALGGRAVASVVAKVMERWDLETLTDDGETSPQNNSSAVLLVTVGEYWLLFTGDAGMPALTNVVDLVRSVSLDFSKVKVIQVPHHGSRRNVGPTILDRLLGPKLNENTKLRNAVVSVAKDADEKHPSKRVTNAFLRRGAPVTATAGRTICFGFEAPDRGWKSVESIPFSAEVEEE